jgi:hypothetical protein
VSAHAPSRSRGPCVSGKSGADQGGHRRHPVPRVLRHLLGTGQRSPREGRCVGRLRDHLPGEEAIAHRVWTRLRKRGARLAGVAHPGASRPLLALARDLKLADQPLDAGCEHLVVTLLLDVDPRRPDPLAALALAPACSAHDPKLAANAAAHPRKRDLSHAMSGRASAEWVGDPDSVAVLSVAEVFRQDLRAAHRPCAAGGLDEPDRSSGNPSASSRDSRRIRMAGQLTSAMRPSTR